MINPLGDVLADSGYVHRDADAWALPLRAAVALADTRSPPGGDAGKLIVRDAASERAPQGGRQDGTLRAR